MDWRLIKRSFTSSLDEEDRQVLEAWLDESERHRQLYEEMKRFVAKRENFQLSAEAKKQFKREFDSRIDGGELCGDVGIADYCGNVALDKTARGESCGLRYRADRAWREKSDVGVE